MYSYKFLPHDIWALIDQGKLVNIVFLPSVCFVQTLQKKHVCKSTFHASSQLWNTFGVFGQKVGFGWVEPFKSNVLQELESFVLYKTLTLTWLLFSCHVLLVSRTLDINWTDVLLHSVTMNFLFFQCRITKFMYVIAIL